MRRGRVAGFVGLFGVLLAVALTAASARAASGAERGGVHEGVASCGGSTCHSRPVASGVAV